MNHVLYAQLTARQMVYVYDVHQDEKKWVYAKYVANYPQLYIPVYYKGVKISTPDQQ